MSMEMIWQVQVGRKGESSFPASGAATCSDYVVNGSIKNCLKMQLLLCNILVLVLLCLFSGSICCCVCSGKEGLHLLDRSSNCGSGGIFAFVVEDGQPGLAVTLGG